MSKDTTNTAGTPFKNDGGSSVPANPSATDCLDRGTVTCKPFYGTKSNGVVTVFDVEVGKVIYLGWDYYNAGRAVTHS